MTDNTIPGMIFFVSAGITAIGITITVLVTVLLMGRKMTDLTQYIDTPEEQSKVVYPDIPPPPYHMVAGLSSF